MKKGAKIILVLLGMITLLLLIRLISPTEIDDVSPEIPCPEIEKYNPDKLWVIPLYNQKPISKNKEWCEKILELNKTLGMHGIYHEPYREFLYNNISEEIWNLGISEFKECFNISPSKFKPPQLKISKENKILVEKELKLKKYSNQILHKVYHCNDKGKFPNWFIQIF